MKRIAPLLLATLLVAACEKEQVLYTTKTHAVEAVPPQPAMRGVQGMGEAAAGADLAAARVDLSAPEAKAFVDTDPGVAVNEKTLAGIVVKVPQSYESTPSTSPMRVGQFRVAGADGTSAEMAVFHFGQGQGGDVKSNVTRWLGQFTPAKAGDSPVVSFQEAPVNGLSVTRLVAAGTWTPSQMPGASGPKGPQADYAMDALIVEGGPEGSVFFRMTGPKSLVDAQAKSIEYLAATVRPSGAPAAAAPADAATSGTTTADPHAGHAHAAEPTPAATEAPAVQPSSDAKPDAQAAAKPDATDGVVDVHGVKLMVPAEWKTVTPSSQMRALQMEIPGDGEFVAFHFGKGQGGSAEANVARWVNQVTQPDGTESIKVAKIGENLINGLHIHTLEVFGTYTPSTMGMGQTAAPREHYGLIGVTIEGGPEGSVFLRLTGPQSTVEHELGAMKAMVEGLR